EFPTVTEQDVMREHDRRALRPAVLGRPGAWIERGAGRGIEKRIPVDPDLVVEPGGASRAIRPGQRGRIDGRGTYQRVSAYTKPRSLPRRLQDDRQPRLRLPHAQYTSVVEAPQLGQPAKARRQAGGDLPQVGRVGFGGLVPLPGRGAKCFLAVEV